MMYRMTMIFGIIILMINGCKSDNDSDVGTDADMFASANYQHEQELKNSNWAMIKMTDRTIKNIEPIVKKNPGIRSTMTRGVFEIRVITSDFRDAINRFKKIITAANLIKDKEILSDRKRFHEILEKSSIDSIIFDGNKLSRHDYKGDIGFSKDYKWTKYAMINLGYGDELEKLIDETRDSLLFEFEKTLKKCQKGVDLTEDEFKRITNNAIKNLPLRIDGIWIQMSPDGATWAEYYFHHLPYAASMAALEMQSTNASISELFLIQQLSGLIERKH